MSLTSSIWLPLLLKGLETSRPHEVILAALRLLSQVAETLEPMRSCLIKPLRALGRHESISKCDELGMACGRMNIIVKIGEKREVGRALTSVSRNIGSELN
jgi:hypothetical protein